MKVVIIGGGFAAATAASELRAQGHTGDITVLAEEPHVPYERPPLSKDVLLGKIKPGEAADSAATHAAGWYGEHEVDLRTGTRATALDLDRQLVSTADGAVPYDRLLLATGSVVRRLPAVEDAAADRVPFAYLRTVDDATAIKAALDATPGGRLLVAGAGWLGLEAAAAARVNGWSVTVVDPAPTPLHAALGPGLGNVFADLHRDHGVDLHLEASLATVDRTGNGDAVATLTDGHEVGLDLLLISVGAVPAEGLAREAGLMTENGVWVDPRLRASDPAVFAAGDVAAHDHPVLGHRLRVEHWDTAGEQGRAAARVMLGGDDPYTRLPYFYTDQYDLGMEYLGHVAPGQDAELVIRRGDDPYVLTAFWLAGDRVLAGTHLNDWDAMDHLRSLVGQDVSAEKLADTDVPLADLAEAAGRD